MEFLEKINNKGLLRFAKYVVAFLVISACVNDKGIGLMLTIETYIAVTIANKVLPARLNKVEKFFIEGALVLGMFYITGNFMFP